MDKFIKHHTKEKPKRTKRAAKPGPATQLAEPRLTTEEVLFIGEAIEIPLEKIARSLKSFNHHSTDGQIALQLFTPPDGYPLRIESAGLASSLDAIATALTRIAAALEGQHS